MEFEFGDFDDDLFDNTGRHSSNNLEEQIKSYKARQVDFEKFLAEEPKDEDIDESSNLLKMKGDYYYFNLNYERALSFYQQSLEYRYKPNPNAFHDKRQIKDRELKESIARCLARLNRLQEAIDIADGFIKNEENTMNYEAYSTALHVKMDVLITYRTINNNEDIEIINDELVTIERLIVLHPLSCQLWMKLGDSLLSMAKAEQFKNNQSKLQYLACYFYVESINNHLHPRQRDIMQKQKVKQDNWLENARKNFEQLNVNFTSYLMKYKDSIAEALNAKIGHADALDDNERQALSKTLIKHEQFVEKFLLKDIIRDN